jgi:YtoQ family protein
LTPDVITTNSKFFVAAAFPDHDGPWGVQLHNSTSLRYLLSTSTARKLTTTTTAINPAIHRRRIDLVGDSRWPPSVPGRQRNNLAKDEAIQMIRSILSSKTFASAYHRAAGVRSFGTSGDKVWKVYLSGEIHSDWREIIAQGVRDLGLPVSLTSPNTSHEDSDDCGAVILGMQEERPNWDKIGANMNALRTKTLLREADVVVVRFGEKYRQWNAAFDAGYASALGKPIITLHPPGISHMLKEVNASANVVCEDPEQVVDTLAYVIRGELPTPRDGGDYVPIADRLGKGNPNP